MRSGADDDYSRVAGGLERVHEQTSQQEVTQMIDGELRFETVRADRFLARCHDAYTGYIHPKPGQHSD